MRLRGDDTARGRRCAKRIAGVILLGLLLVPAAIGRAATPPAAAPAMDKAMSSAGWPQQVFIGLEREATSDIGMLPETPGAIARQWRSFDRNGSALGALGNVGLVALLAALAWLAEAGVARGLSRRLRREMRTSPAGPTVSRLLSLVLCDVAGLAVFVGVFVHARHWLIDAGGTLALLVLASNALIYWRIAAIVGGVLLRPGEPAARLIDMPDREARRLGWFLSATILAITVLIGFARAGLVDAQNGAPHVVALGAALAVAGLIALIVVGARPAFEALIRGRSGGIVGALRAAVARAWLAIGLTLAAGDFLFFVFGLSLGLLSYYRAVFATLIILLLLLVLQRLTELGWQHAAASSGATSPIDRLLAASLRRIVRAVVLLVAAILLAMIWADAVALPGTAAARHAMRVVIAASATLFVAYLAWELIRMAIDRHLQGLPAGPRLPGAAADETEGGPGSRLQTVLPMVRIMLGALIAVVAALVVLSRVGIDTAPLIAGAGVFGLAISFGSQSLVRDIISGLFYMWDDAFRIGEYIDTGRLKGAVEALGLRSVKVRHHNGPLHTIPYGQLGAVTNMSRDFATIKFNLRLEPGTDIELVRKTAKKIGLDMQEEPEVASEVILPLKMQGITEVADTAVVVRFKFTARPVKPSWVQREYVKRMYRVFAERGIRFASGALTLRAGPPTAAVAESEAASPLRGEPAQILPAPSRVA